MHQAPIATYQCLKQVKFVELGVVPTRKAPAKRVNQVHVVAILIIQSLKLEYVHYAVQDLEELLSDTILRAYTASIQPGQIVRALHEIAAQGALQPLQYIEKSRSVERQVHGKIKQMQASGATQAVD